MRIHVQPCATMCKVDACMLLCACAVQTWFCVAPDHRGTSLIFFNAMACNAMNVWTTTFDFLEAHLKPNLKPNLAHARDAQALAADARPCAKSLRDRGARATKQHIYDDAKPSPERVANVAEALAAAAPPAAPAAAAMPDVLAAVAHPALTHFV